MPFLIFWREHLRSLSGIICGSGSFAVQFGDHLRSGIICGAVQYLRVSHRSPLYPGWHCPLLFCWFCSREASMKEAWVGLRNQRKQFGKCDFLKAFLILLNVTITMRGDISVWSFFIKSNRLILLICWTLTHQKTLSSREMLGRPDNWLSYTF